MASQGPLLPSAADNDSGNGGFCIWINPTRCLTDNAEYAHFSNPAEGDPESTFLYASDFGFSIPTDATIDGISVTANRERFGDGDVRDYSVMLFKGGAAHGSDKADTGTTWPTSMADASYGSSSDLWGGTWTPADINDSGFGIGLSGTQTGWTVTSGGRVNVFKITVTYTDGGGDTCESTSNMFCCFRNTGLPKRATITNAVVRFTAKETDSATQVNATLYAEDADSGQPPTDADEAADLVLTSQSVAWSNIPAWTAETTYDTPDISSILQHLVNRSGYTQTSDILIVVKDNNSDETDPTKRTAYSHTDDPAKAPRLIVDYRFDEQGSGGALCGGSATVSKTNPVTVTPAGVRVSGTPLVSGTVTQVVLPYGLLCAGTADRLPFNELPDGVGLRANGSAVVSVDATPTGGLTCSGSAHVGGSQTVVLQPAGLVCDSPKYLGRYYQKILVTIRPEYLQSDQSQFVWTAKLPVGNSYAVTEVAATDLAGNRLPCKLGHYDSNSGKLLVDTRLDVSSTAETSYYVYF